MSALKVQTGTFTEKGSFSLSGCLCTSLSWPGRKRNQEERRDVDLKAFQKEHFFAACNGILFLRRGADSRSTNRSVDAPSLRVRHFCQQRVLTLSQLQKKDGSRTYITALLLWAHSKLPRRQWSYLSCLGPLPRRTTLYPPLPATCTFFPRCKGTKFPNFLKEGREIIKCLPSFFFRFG